MKFIFLISLSAVVLLTVGSCNKKDNKSPELTISSPTEWQSFALNSNVNITGVATDNNALHEGTVIVTNFKGDTVYANYPTVHSLQSFDINYSFAAADTGAHHLIILFEDHDEAQVIKEVTFIVQ